MTQIEITVVEMIFGLCILLFQIFSNIYVARVLLKQSRINLEMFEYLFEADMKRLEEKERKV